MIGQENLHYDLLSKIFKDAVFTSFNIIKHFFDVLLKLILNRFSNILGSSENFKLVDEHFSKFLKVPEVQGMDVFQYQFRIHLNTKTTTYRNQTFDKYN